MQKRMSVRSEKKKSKRKEKTVMGNDVCLPPRVNVIAWFQLFSVNLIGKHSHFPLLITEYVKEKSKLETVMQILVTNSSLIFDHCFYLIFN